MAQWDRTAGCGDSIQDLRLAQDSKLNERIIQLFEKTCVNSTFEVNWFVLDDTNRQLPPAIICNIYQLYASCNTKDTGTILYYSRAAH